MENFQSMFSLKELKDLKIEEYSSKTPRFVNFTGRDIYIVCVNHATNKNVLHLPMEDSIKFRYNEIKKKETFHSDISIEIVEKECKLDYICRNDENYSIWNFFILKNKEEAEALKSAIDVECYYIGDTMEVDGKLYVLNLISLNRI